ncbi:hypothetical protein IRJ41_005345 [Triplophysa rosa]|uniref:Uncharacterized protein n=1 Tax=Triplophysa rosa TaxID=992332 RepID=A0A9W7T2J2_TRIRA|nr:hypothetical protein IRJ41_005345 [Triplophysa rosa]
MDSPVVCRPAEAFDIFDDHQAMLSWGDLVEDALAEASIGPLDIKLPSWAAVDPTVEARDPQHTPQPATGEETHPAHRQRETSDSCVEELCGLLSGVYLSSTPPEASISCHKVWSKPGDPSHTSCSSSSSARSPPWLLNRNQSSCPTLSPALERRPPARGLFKKQESPVTPPPVASAPHSLMEMHQKSSQTSIMWRKLDKQQ